MAAPSAGRHGVSRGPRLLITGINYAPEETGIAPYTAGLAEHLVAQGWEVQVITGIPHYPHWRTEPRAWRRPRQRETVRGVRVQRNWHYVPARQSAVRRGLYELSFFAQAATSVGIPQPDAILGISPSLGGAAAARILARRFGVRYGLVIQDLMGRASAQSGIAGAGRVAGLVGAMEGWAARGATAVGVIAAGFEPQLRAAGVAPERIVRVRNWTHVGEASESREATRARLGLPAERLLCLHAGNMGYKQGLENVVDCALLAQRAQPELLFVLVGDGNQRSALEKRAARLRLTNLRFLPLQPKELFPSVLAAADVLLVNQRGSVRDMSLPGKLTAYFASGRPIVAAVASESETAYELAAAGGGVIVPPDDPAALLQALRELTGAPRRMASLGESGRRFARTALTPAAVLAGYEELLGRLVPSVGREPGREPMTALGGGG